MKTYSASAGSGKTYTLARQVIDLLVKNPASYANLLAVTFTNKATQEMKSRIVDDLYLISNEEDRSAKRMALIEKHAEMSGLDEATVVSRCRKTLENILYDYGQFCVTTIDKFVQKVLRAFAYEQGLPADYNIKIDTDEVLQKAVDLLMESLTKNDQLRDHVVRYAQEQISEGKRWTIDKHITDLGKTLLTDKATLLTQQGMSLDEIKQLKSDLTKRLQDIDQLPTIITQCTTDLTEKYRLTGIHSNFQKVIDKYLAMAEDLKTKEKRKQTIVDLDDHYRKTGRKYFLGKSEISKKGTKGDIDGAKDYILEVGKKLDTIIGGYMTAQAVIKNLNALGIMSDLSQKISEVERETNSMVLGTAGNILSKLIDNCDTPFIYEKCGTRYDTMMIDEFQDTSRLQYQNFLPLLKDSIAQGNDCLVVGDVKQSIYRFRDGDWTILGQSIPKDFNGTYYPEVLDSNYRSKEEIVNFNNLLFERLPQYMDKQLALVSETEQQTMTKMYENCAQKATQGPGGYVYIKIDEQETANKRLIERLEREAEEEAAAIEQELLDNNEYLEEEEEYYNEEQSDDDTPADDDATEIQKPAPKAFPRDLQLSWEYIPIVVELVEDYGYKFSDICFLTRRKHRAEEIIFHLRRVGLPVMSEDVLYVMNSIATRCIADALKFICTGEETALFSAMLTLSRKRIVNEPKTVNQHIIAIQNGKLTEEIVPRQVDSYEDADEFSVAAHATTWETDKQLWAEKLNNLRGLSTIELINEIVNMLPEVVRDKEQPFIESLLQYAREAIRTGTPNVDDFLNLINENKDKWSVGSNGNVDAITVMTIHKAKGLEYKAVFIPYLDWNIESNQLGTLWVDAAKATQDADAYADKKIPINYNLNNLQLTNYKTEAIAEREQNLIDNLNLLYVALTRPRNRLYAWGLVTKPNDKSKNENSAKTMSYHLYHVLKDMPNISMDGETIIYEDGEQTALDNTNKPTNHQTFTHVRLPETYKPSESSTINTEVEATEFETQNNMVSYGITMHSIMEHINHPDDIEPAVGQAIMNGLILPTDKPQVIADITKRLADPQIAAWFDGTAKQVWAETTMVGPNQKLRPDRVIQTADGRTIVVDYKFGRVVRPKHQEQMQDYMSWLAKVGFEKIEGYLWYFTMKKVVAVKAS